jgi:AraC family transcriptional regulator
MDPIRETTRRDWSERLNRVLLHVERHLDEPEEIALERLAALASFSPYHFHRIFRSRVGESLQAYARRLRLERAAHRLKQTDASVTEIALEAGYDSLEAFTRAFASAFSEAPSRFRLARREGPPPGPPLDVAVRDFAPMRAAFIRHVGPYEGVGATWARLVACAGPRGLFGPGTILFGISHDDPAVTPPERLRADACITVPASVVPEGDVGVREIAGGPHAVIVHRGAFERLDETYARLFGEWLPASGREPRSSPCLEIYRSDPRTTPVEDRLTEIRLPLEA